MVKPKWKVGDKVYPVTDVNTYDWYGDIIPKVCLGKLHTVEDVVFNKWNGDYKVFIRRNGKRQYPVHSDDLSKTNTWKDPYDGLPKYVLDVYELNTGLRNNYSCYFILYKNDKKANHNTKTKTLEEKYGYLEANLKTLYDPCNGCWDNRCDKCKPRQSYLEAMEKIENDDHPTIGEVNRNSSCFASFHKMLYNIVDSYKVYPDRMIVKIDGEHLDYPKTDPDDLDWEDLIRFWKLMQSAKALPHYLKLPTMEDCGKDVYFDLRISKISKDRLFWYCNILRDPCEHPRLVGITLHLIDKGRMEPLMAYIMAHVFINCNNHTVISSTEDLQTNSIYDQKAIPDIPAVVRRTLQVHKFLTRKMKPYISELPKSKLHDRWQLHSATKYTKIRYKMPKDVSAESLQTFSVSERKFNKEV